MWVGVISKWKKIKRQIKLDNSICAECSNYLITLPPQSAHAKVNAFSTPAAYTYTKMLSRFFPHNLRQKGVRFQSPALFLISQKNLSLFASNYLLSPTKLKRWQNYTKAFVFSFPETNSVSLFSSQRVQNIVCVRSCASVFVKNYCVYSLCTRAKK